MSEHAVETAEATPDLRGLAERKAGVEAEFMRGRPSFTIEVTVRLNAVVIPEEGGGYSVLVPALPGCVTEGDSIEEVQANLVEAAEGWLHVGHERGKDEAVRVATGG